MDKACTTKPIFNKFPINYGDTKNEKKNIVQTSGYSAELSFSIDFNNPYDVCGY